MKIAVCDDDRTIMAGKEIMKYIAIVINIMLTAVTGNWIEGLVMQRKEPRKLPKKSEDYTISFTGSGVASITQIMTERAMSGSTSAKKSAINEVPLLLDKNV